MSLRGRTGAEGEGGSKRGGRGSESETEYRITGKGWGWGGGGGAELVYLCITKVEIDVTLF